MTTTNRLPPQHTLKAYGVAVKLVIAVRDANVKDAHLRDRAMRAAQSATLNAAEGAGRVTRADEARAFTIARGECVEACAAIEIASVCGATSEERYEAVAAIASELYAMLTALVR
jgi:four helix bundle protein